MVELTAELPVVNLQPGQLYLARNPAILRTILGSCVGATFWSARLRVGALCHAVLPRLPQNWLQNPDLTEGYRYVDFSLRYLARQFDALGARRQELEIKLFGGADVLPVRAGAVKATVGGQNCTVAMEVLQSEGFLVTASDMGGTRGRIVRFHTESGEVLLQRLAGLRWH